MNATIKKERRKSVRINVRDLKVIKGPPMQVLNLSPSGFLFSSQVIFKVGQTADIVIRIPEEQEPVRLTFAVVRRDDPETEHYRAVFINPDPAAVDVLERFIRQSLLIRDLTSLREHYPNLDIETLHAITDGPKVLSLLKTFMDSNRALMATGHDLDEPIEVYLKDIEIGEPSMRLGSRYAPMFLLGSTVLLNLRVQSRSYLFEIAVVESGDRYFRVLKPKLIFYSDKRLEPRKPVAIGDLIAVIPCPFPEGAQQKVRVLDRSPGGMALEYKQNNYPFPGTPIHKIYLQDQEGKELEQVGPVVVRHISPHPEGVVGAVRVGMQFSVFREPLQVGRLPVQTFSVNGKATDSQASSKAFPPNTTSSNGQEQALKTHNSRIVWWVNSQEEKIVGRLDTTPNYQANEPHPVIIIPPAAAKTKETLVGLALTLLEGFASVAQQVAVLRYDGIRRRGESYCDGERQPLGQQMLKWRFSQGMADMESALSFVRDNPYIRPSEVVLVSFSGASLEARRVLARRKEDDVTLWVSCLGAPEFSDSCRRIFGGLDVIEQEKLGLLPLHLRAFGEEIEARPYVRDAIQHGLVGMEQARGDMAEIRCPVNWFHGMDDGWIDGEMVNDLMTVKPKNDSERPLYSIKSGHNMRSSRQAMEFFNLVAKIILRHIAPDSGDPTRGPTSQEVEDVLRRENERLEQNQSPDHEYWREYLFGAQGEVGYDILCEAEDYNKFMHQQAALLQVQAGDVVADLGTGTGNLMVTLVQDHLEEGALPSRLVLSDFVPDALEVAGNKVETALQQRGLQIPVQTEVANLEHNRLFVVKEFLNGWLHSPIALRRRISGLGDSLVERLSRRYDQLTHDVMRGRYPSKKERRRLQRRHEADVLACIWEFSRAARLVRSLTSFDDLSPGGSTRRASGQPITAADLRLEYLDFGYSTPDEESPFKEEIFDRIAASLVLSYLNEPQKVLQRLRAFLKPGGRIVLSTPRPDMDISLIFTRLIEHLESSDSPDSTRLLDSARTFSNNAALLLDLEERGLFHMPDRETMTTWLEQAGFIEVEICEGLGDPPQAIIATARR